MGKEKLTISDFMKERPKLWDVVTVEERHYRARPLWEYLRSNIRDVDILIDWDDNLAVRHATGEANFRDQTPAIIGTSFIDPDRFKTPRPEKNNLKEIKQHYHLELAT